MKKINTIAFSALLGIATLFTANGSFALLPDECITHIPNTSIQYERHGVVVSSNDNVKKLPEQVDAQGYYLTINRVRLPSDIIVELDSYRDKKGEVAYYFFKKLSDGSMLCAGDPDVTQIPISSQ